MYIRVRARVPAPHRRTLQRPHVCGDAGGDLAAGCEQLSCARHGPGQRFHDLPFQPLRSPLVLIVRSHFGVRCRASRWGEGLQRGFRNSIFLEHTSN